MQSFHLSSKLIASLLFAIGLLLCRDVEAQIDSSGHHSRYMVELEPHLVWQWTGDEVAVDDGIGLGFRVSIPIMQDGPVPTLNNNLAIGFGLDWAHFGGGCYGVSNACDEDDIWVPVTLQWNFFLTQAISIFPELGLGFRDAIFDGYLCSNGRCRGSDLEVQPILWFGARFRVLDQFALVLRLGTPSLEFGASFTF
ncbi:MAG TPA: hypothetical protein VHZ95_14490 [Polyangiales bacterium]|nr:hypothetical protein [Polyangiales bacterium]